MIFRETLKYSSNVFRILKNKWWRLTFKEDKVRNLSILKDKKVKLHMYGDIARILYSDQHLVNMKKSFEYETLERYITLLKPGNTVLDIGANIGLFSILASDKLGANGKIYAIEPSKKTFEYLNKNLEINNISNVQTVKAAFSDTVMEVEMSPPKKAIEENFGDSFNQIREAKNGSSDTIQTSLLDDFIEQENIGKVDLIKIDIEGAELMCFKGAHKLLSRKDKPIILFECYDPHCKSYNHSSFDVLNLLNNYGYNFEQYDYAQWIATPQ